MLGFILPLIFGALPSVVEAIAKERNNALNAETNQQRIASEERIKALEAQRDVLVKESSTPWNTIARFCLLGPFAIYLWWIIVNDKIVCKWYTATELVNEVCTTDPLSPWLVSIAGVMISFYFLTDISKIWKR